MKKILRTIGFFSVFAICLFFYHKVFSFKNGDGIYDLQCFYKEKKNTVDVLVLGSSRAFENVNTDILWNEYGIAAFDLCGSVQPFWNTYYYLKEALKTQKPQLVVLEAYRCLEDGDYSDNYRIRVNTQGMRWSLNKLKNVFVSAPAEQALDYLFEFVQYHGRYRQIGAGDFLPYLGNERYYKNWKGYGANSAVTQYEKPIVDYDNECGSLSPKTEKYYRKIIELCQENGIPLFIMVAPSTAYSQSDRRLYNEAKRIAENDYSVQFCDYNEYYDDMSLDFATDFADTVHMNTSGNAKFTRFVADYIQKRYSIPDRRGDESGAWRSWSEHEYE